MTASLTVCQSKHPGRDVRHSTWDLKTVLDPEHDHLGQAEEHLAHALWVLLDRWAQEVVTSHTIGLTAS
jgi:hypothetical protein